jgi:ABC-type multidrug transport system ATPase subunit
MDALSTTALTKRYGHREMPIHPPGRAPVDEVLALEDLSIAVREGEMFGFIGP